MVRGLSFAEIETRNLPNEGIHRSARKAVIVGLVVGLVLGLVLGLIRGLILGLELVLMVGLKLGLGVMLSVGLREGLPFGLVSGLVVGLGFGLYAGGAACLKHVILRLWLIRDGSTPWNYVKFLDDAADRLLLRKVGGGYAFIHRMLLEYFAAGYVEPAVAGAKPAKSSSIEAEL
jgi:hypothetical protein